MLVGIQGLREQLAARGIEGREIEVQRRQVGALEQPRQGRKAVGKEIAHCSRHRFAGGARQLQRHGAPRFAKQLAGRRLADLVQDHGFHLVAGHALERRLRVGDEIVARQRARHNVALLAPLPFLDLLP